MAELPTIDEALDELGLDLPRNRKLECPSHIDKTPSLHVYENGFYCHSCGKSGDGLGLIALFTGQDIKRLFAERAGGTDPTQRRATTRGLNRNDVDRATYKGYRDLHNRWFKWLHEVWADAPQWAFEQSLDIWSQAFDDLRDKMLGHGVYDDDGPMSPFESDKAVQQMGRDLEQARPLEEQAAKQRRYDERRNAYWRRKRALVDPTVYDNA